MAIFTAGPVAGQISGRVGAIVFSHNKGGPYIRNGTIPITSTTDPALAAKARITAASQAFRSLTTAQIQSWVVWAATNPVVNRLGKQITLSPISAYIQLNTRLLADGQAMISVPPLIPPPDPLLTYSQTYDIGVGAFAATFTATPLGANEKLWIEATVVDSAGIVHVENMLRWIGNSAAAQASPFDQESLVVARFGTLQVDQQVHFKLRVFDNATGLISAPLRASGAVVST